jgi:hypothetical protein
MFEIIGMHHGKKEVIDAADSREDAEYLAGEYRMAFGPEWSIVIKRENENE